MTLTVVAGRTCGPCTACCQVLPIDDPRLQKPTGLLCPHCSPDAGCAVYDERPQPCRSWECLWKFFDVLGDEWRPDRSKVVLRPEGMAKGSVTVLVLERGDFLKSDTFTIAVASWIANGTLVSLSRPSKPGHYPAVADVTTALSPAVKARNLAAISHGITRALDILDAFETASDGLPLKTALGGDAAGHRPD